MKKISVLIIFILFNLSCVQAFTDVASFAWAEYAVKKWSEKGLVAGYLDGTFRGNNYITRAELVSILSKLNNSDKTINKRPSNDVAMGDWYFNNMALFAEIGLIKTDSANNLNPDKTATREEAIVMIAKLFGISTTGTEGLELLYKFSDYSKVSPENYKYIAGMLKEGYITGYNNKLNSQSGITRAEIVSIINNMIDEIYTGGTHENKVIAGNLLINGEGAILKNVKVSGYIFVLDGAGLIVPKFTNVESGKSIKSRISQIPQYDKEGDKTLDNQEELEAENEVKLVKISYSETDWTNDTVTAKIRFDNSGMEVINNDGENVYTFERNGEFTFNCEDEKGNIYKYTARVENIYIDEPEISLSIASGADSATITVAATTKNPEIEISEICYIEGDESIGATLRGIEVIDNKFVITKEGTYTVAVKDEVGNMAREVFKWKKEISK